MSLHRRIVEPTDRSTARAYVIGLLAVVSIYPVTVSIMRVILDLGWYVA